MLGAYIALFAALFILAVFHGKLQEKYKRLNLAFEDEHKELVELRVIRDSFVRSQKKPIPDEPIMFFHGVGVNTEEKPVKFIDTKTGKSVHPDSIDPFLKFQVPGGPEQYGEYVPGEKIDPKTTIPNPIYAREDLVALETKRQAAAQQRYSDGDRSLLALSEAAATGCYNAVQNIQENLSNPLYGELSDKHPNLECTKATPNDAECQQSNKYIAKSEIAYTPNANEPEAVTVAKAVVEKYGNVQWQKLNDKEKEALLLAKRTLNRHDKNCGVAYEKENQRAEEAELKGFVEPVYMQRARLELERLLKIGFDNHTAEQERELTAVTNVIETYEAVYYPMPMKEPPYAEGGER